MNHADLPRHVQAMLEPAIYPHAVADIRLVQTHISWVILTGEFAYKLKKPLDFGFLDFSTLEKRRRYCLLELELNRRLAPSIYLEVLALVPDGDRLRLVPLAEAGDHAVDYCLKMRQFADDALMLDQLRRGILDASSMDMLAHAIADFHARAPRLPTSDHSTLGSSAMLAAHIRDNLEAGRSIPSCKPLLEQLERYAGDAMGQLGEAIDRRRADGFVRECHGDLHLRNIAMIDGVPTPFDCIEFNDDFRIIDVMNDIAFLVMDCDAEGRPDLGLRFLSRYLEATGDYAGLRMLGLYAAYRAGVRGKVASLLSRDPGIGSDERRHQIRQAEDYYRLALSYFKARPPRLFAIGGLSGSGKSHLALLGCGPERAVIIRSDATRKRLAAQHADLPLYGEAMTGLTYQTMFDAARQSLEAGWSVILDATFLDAKWRDRVRSLGAEMRVPIELLWLDIPEAELRRRIAARSREGRDVSDADLEVLEMQLRRFRPPTEPDIRRLDRSDRWPELPKRP